MNKNILIIISITVSLLIILLLLKVDNNSRNVTRIIVTGTRNGSEFTGITDGNKIILRMTKREIEIALKNGAKIEK